MLCSKLFTFFLNIEKIDPRRACILEMLASNLGQDTAYPDLRSLFLLSPFRKMLGQYLPMAPQTFHCTSNKYVPGALSEKVNRQGREANPSLPNSVEVRKTWIYKSTPL
jgi:hypothetical protein